VIGSRESVWSAAARCASNLLIGTDEEVPRAEMLYLDPSSIPRIIGKNGSRINLIRNASKCKITIDQPQPGAQVATCIVEVKIHLSLSLSCAFGSQHIHPKFYPLFPLIFFFFFFFFLFFVLFKHTHTHTLTHCKGRTKEIMAARMLIEARESSDDHGTIGAGQSTIELYIPKRFMGHIIGKSGKYINAARHATHCAIQVSEDEPVPTSNGELITTLIIAGASSSVWTAAGHMASYLLSGKTSPDEPEGNVSEVLHVPNEQVGHIIGKQGARIKAFRQSTGCKISIDQNVNMNTCTKKTLK
jgi:predicted RNA-binding protein YlqC (UPF0109 family)